MKVADLMFKGVQSAKGSTKHREVSIKAGIGLTVDTDVGRA